MSITPKSNNAIRRPDLQMLVREYMEGDASAMNGFVADQILPVYPVMEKSATYDVVPKEALLKVQNVDRAAGGTYNRNNWVPETGTYLAKERGWEEALEDTEREDFDQRNGAGTGEQIAVERAMSVIMRAREKVVADLIFNATNFTANALTNEWDDQTNATPIDDIKTAKTSVRNASGMVPNTLIVNYAVRENLRRCDQVVNLITYNFGSQVNLTQLTDAQLASVLGVERLLVAGAMQDTAAGGQDASISAIWSNEYAMLTRIESGIDITRPQLGRTFLWEVDSPGMPVTEQYREEQTRSWIYRVRYYADHALIQSKDTSGTVVSNISQAVSYLFSNVTT